MACAVPCIPKYAPTIVPIAPIVAVADATSAAPLTPGCDITSRPRPVAAATPPSTAIRPAVHRRPFGGAGGGWDPALTASLEFSVAISRPPSLPEEVDRAA